MNPNELCFHCRRFAHKMRSLFANQMPHHSQAGSALPENIDLDSHGSFNSDEFIKHDDS